MDQGGGGVVTIGKALWPFLTQQAPARFSDSGGPGEFVCGQREADGARTPSAYPPELQGNIVFFS